MTWYNDINIILIHAYYVLKMRIDLLNSNTPDGGGDLNLRIDAEGVAYPDGIASR